MASFIGDYQLKVDSKGRIGLPVALKKQMSAREEYRFVIKKDIFESCLIIYPIEEWERQNAIIRSKINPYNKRHNQFLRNFHKGTVDVTLDASNRLLIPKRLLEQANIGKEIYLAGQDGKIEIWDKNLYENLLDSDEEFAGLAEEIMAGVNGEI